MKIGHLHSCFQDNRVLDYFNAILFRTDFETWDYCRKNNIDFLDCFYGQYSQRAKLRELIYPNIKYKHWLTIISQYDYVFLSANADVYPDGQRFSEYVREMVNLFKPDVVGALNECYEKRQSAEKVFKTCFDTAKGIEKSVKPNLPVCFWNQKVRTEEELKAVIKLQDSELMRSCCKYFGFQSLNSNDSRLLKALIRDTYFEKIDVELGTVTSDFFNIKGKFDFDRRRGIKKIFILCPYISTELANYSADFYRYALQVGNKQKDKFKIIKYFQQFKDKKEEVSFNKMWDDIIFGVLYKYGTRGIGVKRIQKIFTMWLKENEPFWGHRNPDNPMAVPDELTNDGLFGKLTQEAVEFYQWENYLTVDGIAGRETLTFMMNFILDRYKKV